MIYHKTLFLHIISIRIMIYNYNYDTTRLRILIKS